MKRPWYRYVRRVTLFYWRVRKIDQLNLIPFGGSTDTQNGSRLSHYGDVTPSTIVTDAAKVGKPSPLLESH
jgi:hypothetical protein